MTRPWLFMADVHARLQGEVQDRQRTLSDLDLLLSGVQKLVSERNCGAVIIAGDLVHDRHQIHTEVLVRLARWATSRELQQTQIVVLAGNHDLLESGGISMLSGFPDAFQVVCKAPMDFRQDGWGVRLIPYHRDNKVLLEQVRAPVPDHWASAQRLLVMHAPMRGALRGVWDFAGEEDGLTVDNDMWPLVVCGHYHMRQILGPGPLPGAHPAPMAPGTVYYLGSPQQTSHAMSGMLTGVSLFYPDTSAWEFVTMPGPSYVTVSGRPELERALEETDPERLCIRIRADVPEASVADLVKAVRDCRWLPTTPDEANSAEKLAVAEAADSGDEALLLQYLQVRGLAPEVEQEYLAEGLRLLRGEIA